MRRMTVAGSVLMSALESSVPVENTVDWVPFFQGSFPLEVLSEFWLDVGRADYTAVNTCIE